MAQVVFHGSTLEAHALNEAIGRNCICTFDPMDQTASQCAAHRALLEDQRFVDGLLFARRMAARFKREEMMR